MSYRNIMLALCGRGDEGGLILKAMELKNQLGSALTVIHVNDLRAGEMSMMMDAPKKITVDDIKERISSSGFEEDVENIHILIVESDSIPKAIAQYTDDVDLLILGHRRMSTFKEHFFDSIDEGIVNHANCPVMIILKD